MTLSQFLSVTREHYQIALIGRDFRNMSDWKPCKLFQTTEDYELLDAQVIDFCIVGYTNILVRIE